MKLRLCLIVVAALALVQGCGTLEESQRPTRPSAGPGGPTEHERQQLAKAKDLENHGDFVSATKIYFDLANETKDATHRMDFDLFSIATLLRGGYTAQARKLLERLPRNLMNKEQALRYRLLLARVYMVDGDTATALQTIGVPVDPTMPKELVKEIHIFRAKAFNKENNFLNAAREFVIAQDMEEEPQAQKELQQSAWTALLSLNPDVLQKQHAQPPEVFSGWVELAYYAKTLSHNKTQLDTSLAIWRKSYPGHPATASLEDLFSGVRDIVSINMENLKQIALLLPLSGRFANAAEAVRDGVMSAYYSYSAAEKPQIKLYDVGQDNANVMEIYTKAVAEGAQLVLGPLDKVGVNQLVHNQTKVTVPTLALNYTELETGEIPNLFQFGLAPEDEARQVAERAFLNGYKRAVAIIPKGSWGERVLKAFAENYQKMDGKLVEFQTYEPSQSDYSLPLRRLLNIDDSEVRFQELKRTLKRKVEFTPYRRQDVDFIFMVAFPRQARLLQPQLKFHYAADLPIFATSHVYTGSPNRNADRDMDGVSFCDIPWILDPEKARDLRNVFAKNTANFERYFRLYALGIDSFNLIAQLSRLAKDPYERYGGQTGTLTMDATRHIRRNLSWAVFTNGLPQGIESAPDQIPSQKPQPAPDPDSVSMTP